MPEYDNMVNMVAAVKQHVDETGHEIIQSDDPMRRVLGYLCVDCGQDPNTIWGCSIVAVARIPAGHPLRLLVASQDGRAMLAQHLNSNANNPMGFTFGLGDSAINPDLENECARLQTLWGRCAEFEAQEEATERLRQLDEARRPTRFDRIEEEES